VVEDVEERTAAIDRAKVKTEERLDGKYLLTSSDPHLTAEEIAVGYKALLEAERGFRDLKTVLELRPVFGRPLLLSECQVKAAAEHMRPTRRAPPAPRTPTPPGPIHRSWHDATGPPSPPP
jgi:hypothetical protein